MDKYEILRECEKLNVKDISFIRKNLLEIISKKGKDALGRLRSHF